MKIGLMHTWWYRQMPPRCVCSVRLCQRLAVRWSSPHRPHAPTPPEHRMIRCMLAWRRTTRLHQLTVASVALLLLATRVTAQQATATDTLTLCMVPASGTLYRTGVANAPASCVASSHVAYRIVPGAPGPAGGGGAAGAAGPRGEQGPAGTAGPAGTSVPQGPQGASGLQGPQGLPGVQGERGPSGLADRVRLSRQLVVSPNELSTSFVQCSSGYVPVGGGVQQNAAPSAILAGSYPGSPETFDESLWWLSVYNQTPFVRTVTLHAICIRRN